MKWVYGDIHGAADEFEALIRRVHTSGDEHICVGDLFDRGFGARRVWELIQEFGIKSTMGNHERKMLAFLEGRRDSVPPHYHYVIDQLIGSGFIHRDDFISFLHQMPLLLHVAPNAIVAHAGVRMDNPFVEDVDANVYGNYVYGEKRESLKNRIWWDEYAGEWLIIYGHQVSEDGRVRRRELGIGGRLNSIGLDTAVVHGGPISAFCLETQEVVQYRSGINHFAALKEHLS